MTQEKKSGIFNLNLINILILFGYFGFKHTRHDIILGTYGGKGGGKSARNTARGGRREEEEQ